MSTCPVPNGWRRGIEKPAGAPHRYANTSTDTLVTHWWACCTPILPEPTSPRVATPPEEPGLDPGTGVDAAGLPLASVLVVRPGDHRPDRRVIDEVPTERYTRSYPARPDVTRSWTVRSWASSSPTGQRNIRSTPASR